ncbi:hypothetical protein VTN02DRAFT_2174 [Thermoascus thermophilus]
MDDLDSESANGFTTNTAWAGRLSVYRSLTSRCSPLGDFVTPTGKGMGPTRGNRRSFREPRSQP